MGILNGNPQKEPMHYGEVFAVWSHLMGAQAMVPGFQALKNHTGDHDLRDLIDEMIANARSEVKQMQELLKHNGIALPPAPPEKPECQIENIPPGARFTDQEVSGLITADIAAGLTACAQAIAQCIREDIGLMFGQFQMKKAQFGAALLKINKEKGWLVPPPLHVMTTTE